MSNSKYATAFAAIDAMEASLAVSKAGEVGAETLHVGTNDQGVTLRLTLRKVDDENLIVDSIRSDEEEGTRGESISYAEFGEFLREERDHLALQELLEQLGNSPAL